MNMQGGAGSAGSGGKEDYLDKGKSSSLDAVEKKVGGASGHNIDPVKMRGTNEKITDKARNMFEKATGKNVPDKVSN